jgi:hypothetical protein
MRAIAANPSQNGAKTLLPKSAADILGEINLIQ